LILATKENVYYQSRNPKYGSAIFGGLYIYGGQSMVILYHFVMILFKIVFTALVATANKNPDVKAHIQIWSLFAGLMLIYKAYFKPWHRAFYNYFDLLMSVLIFVLSYSLLSFSSFNSSEASMYDMGEVYALTFIAGIAVSSLLVVFSIFYEFKKHKAAKEDHKAKIAPI
jgi:hypothetical protein